MKKRLNLVLLLLILMNRGAFSLDVKGTLSFQGAAEIKNGFIWKNDSEGLRLSLSSGKEKNINASGVLFVERIDLQRNSWGTGMSSGKLIPFMNIDLKVGQLVYSDGFSILNNPSIYSSVSPFSSGNSKIRKVSVRLPDRFSLNKPFSLSVKTNGTSGKLKNLNISAGCLFDNEIPQLFIESGFNFESAQKLRLEVSVLARFFQIESGNSDSWYALLPSFYKDYLASSAIQVSVKKEPFSIIFTDAFFTSPFGPLKNTYKLELTIPKLNLSCFFNPNRNVITASGKTMDEMLQVKSNLYFNFRRGKKFPFFWRLGISGFYQANYREKEDVFKAAVGARFLCYLTCFSFVFSADFGLSSDPVNIKPGKYRFSLSDVWYFEKIQPSVKVSADYIPGKIPSLDKWTETVSIDFMFSENPKISFGGTGEFSQTGNSVKKVIYSADISIKYQSKIMDVNGKLSMSIE